MKSRKKYDARFEQLVAGVLLKFGQIDSIGLSLLAEGLLNNGKTLQDGEFLELRKFIENRNGILTFKEEYNLDETMCGSITLREKLDNYQGDVIKDYMDKLNIVNFILRKIREYPSIDVSRREEYFSPTELAVLDEAVSLGLVGKRWNDDFIPNDYEEYCLEKAGEITLFKEDNADLLVQFVIELESRCYDSSLLDDYLRVKNLSANPYEILSVANFELYGSFYDRNILSPNASTLSFRPLHYDDVKGYDQESKDLVTAMFELLESDHYIYVCHPNHLFKSKPLIKGKNEMIMVEWDNIDVSTMFANNDFDCFLDANEAIRYAHRRLKEEMLEAVEQEETNPKRYLAIVERYMYDGVENYVTRGLIKHDASGISLAFNPEYEKTVTKDDWTKCLRMGDRKTPDLYLQRRNPVDSK